MAAQWIMVVAAMVALTSMGGGTAAAGLDEMVPANMVQAASQCFDTMVHNAESMATVFATGTPFSDESCFVSCAKELLGPMAARVQREVEGAVMAVPPPMRECAEIAIGKKEGASENECQRMVDAAQCIVAKAMAMFQ